MSGTGGLDVEILEEDSGSPGVGQKRREEEVPVGRTAKAKKL